MIKVLAAIPQVTDSTDFYRGSWPLGKLSRDGKIHLIITNDWNWSVLGMGNVLFMQRPFMDPHVTIAEMAKAQDRPLVIDFDDDFFCIPADNPAAGTYGDMKTLENVRKIVKLADAVIVSTEPLAERMRSIRPDVLVRVIPNATDFDLLDHLKVQKKETKVILWRGTNTHQRDLMQVAGAIIDTAAKYKDWQFHFLGYHPWFLTENMARGQGIHTPAMDIMVYLKYLQNLQPKIMIVPLADNPFNRAKSNCAWQEGTQAGAITIAPEVSEWKRPGIVNYTDPSQFQSALESVITGKHEPSQSVNDLRHNFDLRAANQARLDIFCEVLSR